MDRKKFLKNVLLGSGETIVGSKILKKDSTYNRLMQQVGFNHLPNLKNNLDMKTVLHRAETRGHANHGWLDSHHTFSFANYYHPERMHFGVLRVLNDDVVQGGKGFGTHPHDNMEIISIPLEGDLEHQDSMSNKAVIKSGDIQVMSAGTGIRHSEYNKNSDSPVRFLQIWMFPNKKNVEPRYDQITLDDQNLSNNLVQILSPHQDDEGVWVHQNAWFSMGKLKKGWSGQYEIKAKGNGLYVFVIDGKVNVAGEELGKRDGFGIWDTAFVEIEVQNDAHVLLMDVPMEV
ncbi:pirin family protein [Portibacter marinus]|uniref:pirin family protein n=1 Tax=Portibacter marinus TaxID=2898660 RepID=UPI001F18638F|nr:pirin family protein [Portibacter marinus]